MGFVNEKRSAFKNKLADLPKKLSGEDIKLFVGGCAQKPKPRRFAAAAVDASTVDLCAGAPNNRHIGFQRALLCFFLAGITSLRFTPPIRQTHCRIAHGFGAWSLRLAWGRLAALQTRFSSSGEALAFSGMMWYTISKGFQLFYDLCCGGLKCKGFAGRRRWRWR